MPMNRYVIATTMLICVVVVFCILAMPDDAYAQMDDLSPQSRPGGEAPGMDIDGSKLPGRLEKGLALGSIIAMIAVMKYL